MARRRKNTLPKFSDLVPTLLLLGAGYWLYRKFVATGGDISRGASELWNLLTIAPVSNVNTVTLPSGESIPVDSIVQAGGIDRDGNFRWQGVPYQIAGRDASGAYLAKRIVT